MSASTSVASLMFSPQVQVAFNLKKGSMPTRQDIDMSAANACMQKGLKILSDVNNLAPSGAQLLQRETINLMRDLRNEFFTNPAMTVDDAFAQFVAILEAAPA